MRVAHALMQDQVRKTRMSDAGRKLVAANRGSAEKIVRWSRPQLKIPAPPDRRIAHYLMPPSV